MSEEREKWPHANDEENNDDVEAHKLVHASEEGTDEGDDDVEAHVRQGKG
jgi:hypothetical protein